MQLDGSIRNEGLFKGAPLSLLLVISPRACIIASRLCSPSNPRLFATLTKSYSITAISILGTRKEIRYPFYADNHGIMWHLQMLPMALRPRDLCRIFTSQPAATRVLDIGPHAGHAFYTSRRPSFSCLVHLLDALLAGLALTLRFCIANVLTERLGTGTTSSLIYFESSHRWSFTDHHR